MSRPEFVKQEHLDYLDKLRDSAETNMFGALPYLNAEFPKLGKLSGDVLAYWMQSFGNPDR